MKRLFHIYTIFQKCTIPLENAQGSDLIIIVRGKPHISILQKHITLEYRNCLFSPQSTWIYPFTNLDDFLNIDLYAFNIKKKMLTQVIIWQNEKIPSLQYEFKNILLSHFYFHCNVVKILFDFFFIFMALYSFLGHCQEHPKVLSCHWNRQQ